MVLYAVECLRVSTLNHQDFQEVSMKFQDMNSLQWNEQQLPNDELLS